MKILIPILIGLLVMGCGKKEDGNTGVVNPNSPSTESAPEKLITNPIIVEKAIRKAAKKPTGEPTKADYEKVTELDLSNKQLTEVPKGLEKLTKLTELDLSFNQLTDVKGLGKLTQLERLSLSFNQLTDVKGLEKLDQLWGLYLTNNKLTNVKGLEKLTQLTNLSLERNPDLTKAQIDELQKALPKCKITHNAK
jgi:Leucine-rich repeat (LRR) protein